LQGEHEQQADDPPERGEAEPPVSLRRRLWPMIDMFERAAKADVPVVWGV